MFKLLFLVALVVLSGCSTVNRVNVSYKPGGEIKVVIDGKQVDRFAERGIIGTSTY